MADPLADRLAALDDEIAELRQLELRAIFAGHAEVDEIVLRIDALRRERLRLEAGDGG